MITLFDFYSSLRRPIEPGDRTGSSSNLPQFHLPTSRQRRSSSHAATHLARFGGELFKSCVSNKRTVPYKRTGN